MNRVLTVPADQMSGADFVKLFAPQRSELELLCAQLWEVAGTGDREEISRLHAEIKAVRS